MEEIQPTPTGPRTSVLIISHNSIAALRRCLDSLLRTTDRKDVEILVVDKGSQDGSGQLDSEYPDTTFLRLPRNFGFTKAVNVGTRTAAGDFLLVLDAHTEVEPGAVVALTARLESDPDAVAVCPLLVDPESRVLTRVRSLPTTAELIQEWKSGEPAGTVPSDLSAESISIDWPTRIAFLVRKQFVKGMNYLDERYGEFGGDLEIFYQIRHAGKKVLLLPGVKVIHRPEDIELPSEALAQLSADQALAAISYASKHDGFAASLSARLGAIFYLLSKILTFQQPGFQISRLTAIVSGQKIDGSQYSI